MAIARGAGTEIIRSHAFEDMSGSAATNKLIVGEAHHIYTVLSIIIRCGALNTSTDKFTVNFWAFDMHAGAADQNIELFTGNPQVGETYIWNDKFSFNGFSPTGVSTAYDTATEHNAVADQGGTVQELRFECESDADYNILVTYVDQNNA